MPKGAFIVDEERFGFDWRMWLTCHEGPNLLRSKLASVRRG
jgi:hypothetical protein